MDCKLDQTQDDNLSGINIRDSMNGTFDDKTKRGSRNRESDSICNFEYEPSILKQNPKTPVKSMDHAASDKGILIHSLCDLFSKI